MIETMVLNAYYGKVFDAHKHILEKSAYEMICYLQRNFNHKKDGVDFNDKALLEKKIRLLKSEMNETRNDGLVPQNLKMIRDGIADQLTVAYFLAFVVNGLEYKAVELDIEYPKSYTEYCERTEVAFSEFEKACFELDDINKASDALNKMIALLYHKPLFSAFSAEYDLIDVTLSSLSKVCTATEDLTAEEVAERTLAAYKERGYIAHIEKTEAGYGIFVTEDCVIKEEAIPQGKFLKSLFLLDPILADVEEQSVW